MNAPAELFNQHLIDPEICIRCNTCEATCPVGAITHDSRNYVVIAEKCNFCMACVPPCPTGSIDNWRMRPKSAAYTVEEQLSWDDLPPAMLEGELSETQAEIFTSSAFGATVPPWSAAHPYTNLYGPKEPTTATVVGNVQVNEAGTANETHHIVLDFGNLPFPVLEGQSIGIIPPGQDTQGNAHHARQYSIASPRNGERAGYNNLSITVKRVLEDHDGKPVIGVASNFLCDLKTGDKVKVIGPFGSSFLMPNHPKSNIVMICTGTGSAPMRAMTEWRRRLRQSGKFEGGKLMLFFGARTQKELPYFGPLQKLPKDFIDINFAFSREQGQTKRYVQDLLRERSTDLLALLKDSNTYIYVCGLKSMEEGVVLALRDVANQAGLSWDSIGQSLKQEGRLHLETY
ncbi:MAG: benzoyl-CoA 2,3-epoxidase subunit BoxA [Burkholderiales bacterium]|jgi:benzoyl-CoA 2,3-dioxygenase component A|nr:benzoyl-CoA 2,3-epoxidase subunit BoxA [Burkholderiales bacterium]